MFLKTFHEKKKVIHYFIHTFIFLISGIKTFLKQFSNKYLNASVNKTHTYSNINQQFALFIMMLFQALSVMICQKSKELS